MFEIIGVCLDHALSTPSSSTCLDINTVNVSSSLHGMKILNTDSLCFSSTTTSSTTSSTTLTSPSHDINTVSVSSRLHGMIILNTNNLIFLDHDLFHELSHDPSVDQPRYQHSQCIQ